MVIKHESRPKDGGIVKGSAGNHSLEFTKVYNKANKSSFTSESDLLY